MGSEREQTAAAGWEWAGLAAAMTCALALGAWRLGAASYWHDELVHVYVAEHVLARGWPALPGGAVYPSGALHTYLLAAVLAVFGDGEAAMRAPSVLASAANVALVWWLARRLFGPAVALAAAAGLAVSPWAVSWAREARFYTLQQGAYLAFLTLLWLTVEGRRAGVAALGLLAVYTGAMATALQSVFFLAPAGAYTFVAGALRERRRPLLVCAGLVGAGVALALYQGFGWLTPVVTAGAALYAAAWALGRLPGRHARVCGGVGLALGVTLLVLYYGLPQADHDAIFKEAGLTAQTYVQETDRDRSDRLYYPRFLAGNFSTGFFALAVLGTGWMLAREGRRGLFAGLAFWVPLVCLAAIGYRRSRFLFFAYPMYVVAAAYGGVMLGRVCAGWRRGRWRGAAAVLAALFLARLAVSGALLVQDSTAIALGAQDPFSRRHPEWRAACAYVRERLTPETAVVSTTWLPADHYVGRCDAWYPSRVTPWEWPELPSRDMALPALADFRAFVAERPSGYFLAYYRRWEYVSWLIEDDIAWVEEHLVRLEEASTADITVYAWGDAARGVDAAAEAPLE